MPPSSNMSQSSSSSNQLVVEQDLSLLLEEIHTYQATVMDSLQEDNWRFDDATSTFNLEGEAKTALLYIAKLREMRQVMVETKRRLARLQERSLRVRNTAERQSEQAYRDWLVDIEYEKQLRAKFEPGLGENAKRKPWKWKWIPEATNYLQL